jgi:hypothetical protein
MDMLSATIGGLNNGGKRRGKGMQISSRKGKVWKKRRRFFASSLDREYFP